MVSAARGLVAEFASADDAVAAVVALRALGYTRLDAYTPYPTPDLERALGVRRTRIPRLAFAAGASGCALGYLILWSTNAYDYPLDVGGRPLDSLPADIPIMFETTVLLAALTAFALVFLLSGMPRLHHPIMEVDGFDRVAVDRFWITIDARDASFDPSVRARLGELHALFVREIGEAA
jgi:hypothetical protein